LDFVAAGSSEVADSEHYRHPGEVLDRVVSGILLRSRRFASQEVRVIMLDVIFIFATAVFFVVAILYVRGCERLR
jgi:hypothetical protein